MEKRTFKPGFEFIFTLSILAVLGLPPLVSAQAPTKDLQININNGDTTINGKNINKLSAKERKEALKDIDQITDINDQQGAQSIVLVTGKHKGGKRYNATITPSVVQAEPNVMITDGDVQGNQRLSRIQIAGTKGNDSTVTFSYSATNAQPATFNYSMPDARPIEMHAYHMDRNDRPIGFGWKNTQNFMYTTTDNDGISTHVNYRVSDHPATLDYDAGKPEKAQMDMLNLTDLSLVPEFSAGKTVLMFSLPSKANAQVEFKDSKGNLLWSEKALNGSFNKSFALGLNGLYYLQVKQGNKIVVKEIMKD
jgi:hypothetical protein